MKKTVQKITTMLLAVCMMVVMLCQTIPVNADEFQESKTIWVLGDSIASEHDIDAANEVQITGWGNVLQQFVAKDVTIVNKARSGRSSRSYTTEQVYREVMKGIKAGDYVIIQFGHNDEKEAPRYTDPTGDSSTEGSYKYYLKKFYIEPIYEKGGRVILATSVVRRLFVDDKLDTQTHEVYVKAMRELVEECRAEGKEIYLIDTFQMTHDLYESIGAKETEKLHAVTGSGDSKVLDDTHYSPYGATLVASMIAQELKGLGLDCCQTVNKAYQIETDETALELNRTQAGKFSWR